MKEVVMVDAVRTPIDRYKGGLKGVRSDDLGAVVIKALMKAKCVQKKQLKKIVSLTTLIYEMKKRNEKYGLATMCIGVGQGISLIVENVNDEL